MTFVAPDPIAEQAFWNFCGEHQKPYRIQDPNVSFSVGIQSDPEHTEYWHILSHVFTFRVMPSKTAYDCVANVVTEASRGDKRAELELIRRVMELNRPNSVAQLIQFYDTVSNMEKMLLCRSTLRSLHEHVVQAGVSPPTAWHVIADLTIPLHRLSHRPICTADPNEWASVSSAATYALAEMGIKGQHSTLVRALKGLRDKAPALQLPDMVRLLEHHAIKLRAEKSGGIAAGGFDIG